MVPCRNSRDLVDKITYLGDAVGACVVRVHLTMVSSGRGSIPQSPARIAAILLGV